MPTKDVEPVAVVPPAPPEPKPASEPEPPSIPAAEIRMHIRADIDRMNAVIATGEAQLLRMRAVVDDKIREYNALGRGFGVSTD